MPDGFSARHDLLRAPRDGPPCRVLRPMLARLALRCTLSSGWLLVGADVPDGSCIVVAPHQTGLDIPVAVSVSDALAKDFATWAHPEVLRRAPFLRRAGLLEAVSGPQQFQTLIAESRRLLRSSGERALWVFPQGMFGHRSANVAFQPGIRLLLRACPEVPVLLAGIDYSLFRTPRPHCFIELTGYRAERGSLATQLAAVNLDAGCRAGSELPHLLTPHFRPQGGRTSPERRRS